MTLMQKLRAHSRTVTWFLIVPVVVAFTFFGLSVSLSMIFGSSKIDVMYEIEGKKVTRALHQKTYRIWSAIRGLNENAKPLLDSEVREIIGECILAEKYGFKATEAQIDSEIYITFGGNQNAYSATLKRARLTDEDIRFWFRQKILREKYSNFRRNVLVPTASEIYKKFLYERESFTMKYTMVKPEDFREDVVINDEKLKEFYDRSAEAWKRLIDLRIELKKAKNALVPDKDAVDKLEKQVKELEQKDEIKLCDITDGPFAHVHFIYVPYEEVKKKIEVDPNSEEIRDYYIDHVSNYRRTDLPPPPVYGPFPPEEKPAAPGEKKPETSSPQPGKDESAAPAKAPAAGEKKEPKKSEPADDDGKPDAAEKAKDDSTKEASLEKKAPPAPRSYYDYGSEFLPLDEVRDRVVKDYLDDRARSRAEEILTEVRALIADMEQIKYDFTIIDPVLKEKLGEKYPFKIDDKVVTPKNAETIEVYGCSDLKIKAFEDYSYWTHYLDDMPDKFSEIITVPTGKYIFFVTAEDKAKIRPFEEVKGIVETAYRQSEQKRLAKERAEEIIAALQGGKKIEDLGPAITWMTASGTKPTLMYLREFGESGFKEGMVCDHPIWVDNQREKGWRVQVLVKIIKPDVASFARQFESYRVRALSDLMGTRPDQPKGVLGAWIRFDKKAFGIKEEEEK